MCYGMGVGRELGAAPEPGAARLPRRRLGRAGPELTVLGLGGAFIGEVRERDASPQERGVIAARTVRRAVALGINYIDTSPLYQGGVAERSLGIALRELSAAQREQLHVSTKVGTRPGMVGRYDRASVLASLEQSREALGREYLDIVFVHDPQSDEQVDAILAPGGAADAILELKAAGSVGALGLGVRTHRWQRRCLEDGRFDVALLPYDYNLARDSAWPLIELAQARGAGVVNASPYLRGLLAGPDPAAQARYGAQEAPDVACAAAIHAWCRQRGIDVGALAMQFSLRHPGIASTLVGSRDAAEIDASYRHATASLPDEVWSEFTAAAAGFPPAAPGGETGILQ